MESQVFKCALSPDKLAQSKKSALRNQHVLFPLFVIVYVIGIGRNLYIMSEGEWAFLLSAVGVFLTVSFVVMLIFLVKFMICLGEKNTMMFEILEEKELAWNAISNEFTYKDKNRTLRFTGDKVTKWMILASEKQPVDILLLDNGEQIVLEHEFNPGIHPFLENNQSMLRLPDFSKLPMLQILFLNYYKDSI